MSRFRSRSLSAPLRQAAHASSALALSCVLAACLGAQPQQGNIAHRQYCDKLRLAIGSPNVQSDYRRALSNVHRCPEIAASILVSEWAKTHQDTATARILGEVTGTMANESLFEAVTAAALQKTKPRSQRAAAIQALALFYNPRIRFDFKRLEVPGLDGWSYIVLAGNPNPPAHDHKLSVASKSRALDTLTSISKHDEDPVLKAIAFVIAKYLNRSNS